MKITKRNCTMKRKSDDIDGVLYIIEEVEGINFPFQIYIPNVLSSKVDIILSNNTPSPMKSHTFDEALKILKGEAIINNEDKLEDIINNQKINGISSLVRHLTYDFNNVCLIPCIPRPIDFDTSYLGYKVYNNEFDEAINAINKGWSKYKEEELEKFRNLDKQVYNMIKYTMNFLDEMMINHDDKVIATGYSAASKFSNFFTALHPDIVKAVIAGGTGGNSIIPDKSINQVYPVGVSDIPNFDFDTFKSIPQFYYIGDSDYNDICVFLPKYELETDEEKINKYGIYKKDISGNKIPKRIDGLKGYHDEVINGEIKHIPDRIPFDKVDYDLDINGNYQLAYNAGYYTLDQIKYIVNNLGDNVQDRFNKLGLIYKELGVNSTFKKYPGNHVTVQNNIELYEDIDSFVKKLDNDLVR